MMQRVDRNALPPHVDFWIPGRNKLVYSSACDFKIEIKLLSNTYRCGVDYPAMSIELTTQNGSPNPWCRDTFTKSEDTVFVLNADVFTTLPIEWSAEIIQYNLNIGMDALSDKAGQTSHFKDERIITKLTKVIIEGGNVFHCVNAQGKYVVVLGEMGLVSRLKISTRETHNAAKIASEVSEEIGSKSYKKYNHGRFFREKAEIIEQRKMNKRILQSQFGKDVEMVVVPNAWAIHIDLEMAALPNGVFLVHSFEESFKLMQKYKNQIPDYYEVLNNMESLANKTQHLFAKTKQKLEKHGFIVKDVCGFITRDEDLKGLLAMGFNGIVIVSSNGEIAYTLPPNPAWYEAYMTAQLREAGVSHIHSFVHQQDLSLLQECEGFVRCETHTFPYPVLKEEAAAQLSPKF